MDVFDDLIRGVRAQGSLFGSSTHAPPWALHFVDGAPLTLCTVLGGSGWIVPEKGEPEPLGAYETVIVRGPGTFTFVDALDTVAEPIACGESCAGPEQGGTRHRLGWNDHSESGSGATTLIVGAYPARGEINRRLLEALPVLLRVEAGGTGDAVLDHLAAEVAVDAPGQQVVLDRLLDWMLVCTLREWFDRPGGEPPSWWAAQRDPVAGDALRLLHADPAASWTVASLADRIGVSRSTLAKRFADYGWELQPKFAFPVLGTVRFAMHHEPEPVEALAQSGLYDVVVYGHTHELVVRRAADALVINPGETCGWLTGAPSCVILELETLEPTVVNLTF